MVRFFKKRAGRKPRRMIRRARKFIRKPGKVFTKAVQRIIHKDVETKQAFASLPSTAFNSGITAVGDIQNLVPTITNGTGDNARIGDQIRGIKMVTKGAIVYSPSLGSFGSYANSRLAVRLMVIQPRYMSDYATIYANFSSWSNALLKKGGTTTGFSGTLSDLWAPINSDAIIKYYDKIHYIQGPYERTAVGGYQMLGSTKFFNISLKMRNKLLRYDANVSTGLQPTNYAPVLLCGYTHLDGSSPDTTSTAIVLQFDTIFSYEDA